MIKTIKCNYNECLSAYSFLIKIKSNEIPTKVNLHKANDIPNIFVHFLCENNAINKRNKAPEANQLKSLSIYHNLLFCFSSKLFMAEDSRRRENEKEFRKEIAKR